MRRNHFFLSYVLLLILQILICNYLQLSPLVTLSILPVMILMLPIQFGTIFAMALAFVTGLCVDFLSEGVVGLNALALVPVAFLRSSIIRLVFGSEIFARNEDISIRKHGIGKMAVAIFVAQSLFLIVYIWADGAFTHHFWFNALRFTISVLLAVILSLVLSRALAKNDHDL